MSEDTTPESAGSDSAAKVPAALKPSAVELAKIASHYLLGDIPQELADGAAGFGKASIQLL